ncbi:hypothetical protein GP486_005222 [Trichoglossum hirsutum]|uniref:Diphthine--ammonia ligase n=1 Tax=Trichoglossum hirsutum TaxID=265104 RepID=A0A9P8RMN8_9PEZI|nr:hypothetical protein GP486_005222 [Trichoglossum hirsutum]
MGPLNVIALVSGGKDSFLSILHCLANGHKIIALANLHPPLPDDGSGVCSDGRPTIDDLNSFMYQTVGHNVIPLYEEALGIPLYRQPISGTAIETGKNYHPPGDDQPTDETESLVPLLRRVLGDHPTANAISTGAVLSDYQRTRVESVARRLGLVPLSYLWQFPYLSNNRPETSPLDDMRTVGQDSRIIKVASGGLDASYLWENVAEQGTVRRLLGAVKRFGGLGRGAVLGEGGEYETLTVDGPAPLWKKRIHIEDQDRVTVQGGGGSMYLKIANASLVAKESAQDPAEGSQGLGSLGDFHTPKPLSADFGKLVESIDIGEEANEDPNPVEPEESVCEGDVIAKETWAVRRGETTLFISNMVANRSERGSAETEIADIVMRLRALLESQKRSPDDIVYTTILLRSMASFPQANKTYSTLFSRPNPPARATVACGEFLREGVHILLSVIIDLRPRRVRKGLHVESRSYWAPANIGPYSQAVASPLQTDPDFTDREDSKGDSLVYVAGQIPLEPATMEFPDLVGHETEDLYSFRFQAALALQNLWRIGESMSVKWWIGGIAFIARSADIRRKAMIAWRMWEERNSASWGIHSGDSRDQEGEEEEAVVDIWDQKYGRADPELSNVAVTRTPLPNFELIDATESPASTAPYFAVEVDELPRDSHIEWSGLGVSGSGRTRVSSNRLDDISLKRCQFSDESTTIIYGTIGGGLSNDGFRSAIERMLLSDASVDSRRDNTKGTLRILQITVYTARDPGWELAWSPSSPVPNLPAVTVMPCRSVWGIGGNKVGAGVVVRSETLAGKREHL